MNKLDVIELMFAAKMAGIVPKAGPTPREQELEAQLKQEREAARGLVEALEKCNEVFSNIRNDWTDPRSDCREGWETIDAALAAYKAKMGEV